MKIYFDENTSRYLCRGLQELQTSRNNGSTESIEVLSVEVEFGMGTDDEDWIPVVGKAKGVAITHDLNIMRTKHQRELCEKHGVGLIIIRPPSKKEGMPYWEQVKLLINNWPAIVKLVSRTSGHYHYELKPKSGLKEM